MCYSSEISSCDQLLRSGNEDFISAMKVISTRKIRLCLVWYARKTFQQYGTSSTLLMCWLTN